MTIQKSIDHEKLQSKILDGSVTKEDFRKELRKLKTSFKQILDMLEWACELNPNDRELYSLYREVSVQNSSELIDELRSFAYYLVSENGIIKDDVKRNELTKAFDRQGYRLLELTRMGKREEVQYILLRIFFSFQIDFSQVLLKPFKYVYSDEMFKVFLFSFLSGVLGKSKENN